MNLPLLAFMIGASLMTVGMLLGVVWLVLTPYTLKDMVALVVASVILFGAGLCSWLLLFVYAIAKALVTLG